MNQQKIKPQLIWDLYKISSISADKILVALGFSFIQKTEHLILYRNDEGVFMLIEEAGVITQVHYKMREEVAFNEFVKYAKDTLDLEIIFEEFKPSSKILRLDNETCTLMCRVNTTNGTDQSFGIILLDKLPLPTPENKIEVIMAPPPTPEAKI